MATQHDAAARHSLRGRLLIASPFAENSPYQRSIVHLLEHDSQGAIGVILDGSFSESLSQLREYLPRIKGMQTNSAAGVVAVPVKVAMWPPGQLDQEVQTGIWFDAPSNPQLILGAGVPSWHELVREVGRSVYRNALGIEEFPVNCWLN